jgi:hypothetical protein
MVLDRLSKACCWLLHREIGVSMSSAGKYACAWRAATRTKHAKRDKTDLAAVDLLPVNLPAFLVRDLAIALAKLDPIVLIFLGKVVVVVDAAELVPADPVPSAPAARAALIFLESSSLSSSGHGDTELPAGNEAVTPAGIEDPLRASLACELGGCVQRKRRDAE